jgi:hypothetical protein
VDPVKGQERDRRSTGKPVHDYRDYDEDDDDIDNDADYYDEGDSS